MIVAKFGGTSLSTVQRIHNLCNITKKRISKKPVIVVSAIAGVTDLLLEATQSPKDKTRALNKIRQIHSSLITSLFGIESRKEAAEYVERNLSEVSKLVNQKNYSKQEIDAISAYGEKMSSFIICQMLKSCSISARQVISDSLIVTDNNFQSADFLLPPTQKNIKNVLLPIIKNNIVPVVTGFIGATKRGQITTLGRGGSDYTAAILGFCLKAEEVEIWTDVDGIFTSDPKIVKNVKPIPQISYREASELAAFGAKVLHPRTIKPAVKAKIPVRVLNTQKPQGKGTLICDKPALKNPITAISYKRKISLVNIYSTEMLFSKGFLAKIFQVFKKYNISVDVVSVSEVSVSVTLENIGNLSAGIRELSKFSTVTTDGNHGMVSIIGEGIVKSTSTIRKIFEILDKKKILVKMVSLGASDINVSLVIQYDRIEEAVNALHNQLLIKNIK